MRPALVRSHEGPHWTAVDILKEEQECRVALPAGSSQPAPVS